MTVAADTFTRRAREQSLRRVMGGLAPISIAVQICSFGSALALAHVLGANGETDAYYLGLSIPVLAYGIFIGALRGGAIPALIDVSADDDGTSFRRAASEALTGILAAAALVTLLVTALAELALPALASGRLLDLTRLVLLELAPYGVFGAVTGFLSAVLAVRGKFAAPVLVMIFEPVVKIVFTIVFGHAIGIQALIVGNLLGAALAVGALLMVLRRDGITLGFGRFNTPFVRATARLSLPLIVSMSVLQVNPVVDRAMATGLGAGSVAALSLGLKLFGVPAGLLTGLLAGPITATWAARHASHGWPALQKSATRAVASTVALVPPLVIIGFVLRHELVDFLFAGRAYSGKALADTAAVFGMILFALPAQALIVVFSTLFIVRKNTVFPMKVAFGNVVLNVILNIPLRGLLGVGGIALSTTLTYTLVLAVYAGAAHRRWGPLFVGDVRRLVLRGALTTAVTAGAAVAAAWALPIAGSRAHTLVVIALVAAAGIVAHTFVLMFSRDPLVAGASIYARRLLRWEKG
jgi:putative peptidoglycan lipid II flippase